MILNFLTFSEATLCFPNIKENDRAMNKKRNKLRLEVFMLFLCELSLLEIFLKRNNKIRIFIIFRIFPSVLKRILHKNV